MSGSVQKEFRKHDCFTAASRTKVLRFQEGLDISHQNNIFRKMLILKALIVGNSEPFKNYLELELKK